MALNESLVFKKKKGQQKEAVWKSSEGWIHLHYSCANGDLEQCNVPLNLRLTRSAFPKEKVTHIHA